MLFKDPQNHARLRSLVSKAFHPLKIDKLRSRIQEIVDHLLDRTRDSGGMDIIADFAFPLPVSVISEILGVPASDHGLFHGWSADIAQGSGVEGRRSNAHTAIATYFRELIARRRKRPQSDFLSNLILAQQYDPSLTEAELIDICGLLFVAGHETTADLIGNGMLALLQHPSELQTLRAQPFLVHGAVEELLRYDSPVQRAGRVANVAVPLGEKVIAEGAVVLAMIGAANRDPAHFVDPDRLDIKRRETCHLAFGTGAHFCLGELLARAEAQIAINTLLRRLPRLELVDEKLTWRSRVETRGLKKLRVRF
jgi:cytochrome P450